MSPWMLILGALLALVYTFKQDIHDTILRLWHRSRSRSAIAHGYHCWGCLHHPDFHKHDVLYRSKR